MSCPLNRNRWQGSGYEKPSSTNSELDAKMKQMLAERDKQDAMLYPQTQKELHIVGSQTTFEKKPNLAFLSK